MRREFCPAILYVSASRSRHGSYGSISEAVHNASEGDQIIVEDGIYSIKTTRKRYPTYLPPRCQLIGRGAGQASMEDRKDICLAAEFPPGTVAVRLLLAELFGVCPAGMHDDPAQEVFMR